MAITKKDIKSENLALYKSQDFRNFAALMIPDVPVYDTSVKNLMQSQQPVLPMEEQFYDNDTPIHIYKSFDFKNMPMDPNALSHARNYVAPVPNPTNPVVSQPVANAPENAVQ